MGVNYKCNISKTKHATFKLFLCQKSLCSLAKATVQTTLSHRRSSRVTILCCASVNFNVV